MTGNQLGMKGKNLQNHQRYLKANKYRRKELRTGGTDGGERPSLNSAMPYCSLTPGHQHQPS